jgi:signal transduction histidine kinase
VRRRLFLQIWAAFLAVTIAWLCLTATAVRMFVGDDGDIPRRLSGTFQLLGDHLAEPDAAPEDQQAELERIGRKTGLRLGLWSASGEPLGAVGDTMAPPNTRLDEAYWFHDGAPGVMVKLDDGRWLGAAVPGARHRPRPVRLLASLGVIALVLGVGSWPLARRITMRLEKLQLGVEAVGRGDLSARVAVDGSDEVAELARAFNTSADRIHALVDGQRRMLASASHELRSPLTRLRMAVELLDDGDAGRKRIADGAVRDIGELDDLIDELLLASRLETRPVVREDVDLGAIVAEEASRACAAASGAARLQGEARALRRLVRNLIENALRHGGTDVVVTVGAEHGTVRLVVEDRGPGVAESERERIFEPFYRADGHRESEGGVGLGLALVRAIARAHGGDVRYEPRDGGGSRFVVQWPT